MLNEIVNYLFSLDDEEYHELNDFFQNKYPDTKASVFRENMAILVQANRIRNENNPFRKLDNYSRINESDYQNTYRDLSNLMIKAKLTPQEKEKMKNEERNRNTKNINVTINGDKNLVPIESSGDIKQVNNSERNKGKSFWENSWVKGVVYPLLVILIVWLATFVYENWKKNVTKSQQESLPKEVQKHTQ